MSPKSRKDRSNFQFLILGYPVTASGRGKMGSFQFLILGYFRTLGVRLYPRMLSIPHFRIPGTIRRRKTDYDNTLSIPHFRIRYPTFCERTLSSLSIPHFRIRIQMLSER